MAMLTSYTIAYIYVSLPEGIYKGFSKTIWYPLNNPMVSKHHLKPISKAVSKWAMEIVDLG